MKFFEQLDVIIEGVISEMVDDERKKQQQLSKKIDKLGLRAADESAESVDEAEDDEAEEDEEKLKGDAKEDAEAKGSDDDEPGTATSKKLKDPTPKQLKKPSFKAIASNINLLRGGKSIKDPDVRKNLQDYIDKLSTSEKRDVLIYLNSLAQVMSGVTSGAAAELPDTAEKKIEKQPKKKDKVTRSAGEDASVIVVGGE